MAMRKLREAIVATSRTDAFAIGVYEFVIRAAILEKHVESYQPALLHLLRTLYTSPALSTSDRNEFEGYYILDLACRQGNLAGVFKARNIYGYRDTRVELVVNAMVQGNWSVFWRVKQMVNEHQKRLMEWGEDSMRKHALRCLGRSYLSVDRLYFERSTGWHWKDLKEHEDLGWKKENDKIIIKPAKRK